MEDLVKHLIQNGIEEGTANKIAASYETETVDAENLQKALNNVAEVMRDAGNQTNEEIAKSAALEESQGIAEAVTKGADALLSEVREQNDALAKGLIAIGEEMRAVKTFLASQYGAVAQVTEQVEAVKKSLNEPVMQKSITAEAVDSPYDETATPVDIRNEMINKALTELKASGDDARQATLRKAITQLECGVSPDTVKNHFGI